VGGQKVWLSGRQILERAMGIEPTSEAWEASILPLYDARSMFRLYSGINFSYSGLSQSRMSLMDLITKRIRIIGTQQNGPEYLYEALDFVAQGKVKTIVET
jgi:hypothetical protein